MMPVELLIESSIRGLICLAGIMGNSWLALRSLACQKSGIRTNEVLFINLAVSNLISGYLVDLPDTMADFAGRWFLGKIYCSIFSFCANFSETSSIYTTFFICVFWHQKLVGSLKRGGASVQLDSLRLVSCLLAGSWMLALVFSIPCFFFVTVVGTNESQENCEVVFPTTFDRHTYEIFYLTLANALPVAGIVFASVQIVITLLQNQRRIRAHTTTKETGKDENNSSENRNNKTTSGPGTMKDLQDSASVTHIYTGVPASSCPNRQDPSGHSSLSTPMKRATKTESGAGGPTNLPRLGQTPARASPGSSNQVRAAKSVVAVASVFLVCWLTHLLLRITSNIHISSVMVEVAGYIAASYICIIPYIFLHGVKKLSCSCKG